MWGEVLLAFLFIILCLYLRNTRIFIHIWAQRLCVYTHQRYCSYSPLIRQLSNGQGDDGIACGGHVVRRRSGHLDAGTGTGTVAVGCAERSGDDVKPEDKGGRKEERNARGEREDGSTCCHSPRAASGLNHNPLFFGYQRCHRPSPI